MPPDRIMSAVSPPDSTSSSLPAPIWLALSTPPEETVTVPLITAPDMVPASSVAPLSTPGPETTPPARRLIALPTPEEAICITPPLETTVALARAPEETVSSPLLPIVPDRSTPPELTRSVTPKPTWEPVITTWSRLIVPEPPATKATSPPMTWAPPDWTTTFSISAPSR